tara:strand:- start:439 stop:951 length:513 start_codon:yes stop_codon:yes gene_type:complete
MSTEQIINKVANSGLVNIDLSDFAPKENILELDIKQFLNNGFILKEKDFRKGLGSFDFELYKEKTTALYCSADTIIPMWAYMLITSLLNNIGSKVFFGNKEKVFQSMVLKNIEKLDGKKYKNKRVLVNGCSNIKLNESFFIAITKKLQDEVISLMFGEACSAVPIYKKRK